MFRRTILLAVSVLAIAPHVSAEEVLIATGADVRVVPIGDVAAKLTRSGNAARIEFDKTGDVRRLLGLEAKLAEPMAAPKALEMEYSIALGSGPTPRPAAVVYERGGGAWFKVGNRAIVTGEVHGGTAELCRVRMPMGGLKEAGFSNDASGKLEWEQVERMWIGLVMDDPTKGVLTFMSAKLTDEPYTPTHPLNVTNATNAGTWSVGHDKAAKATLTTPSEGPGGGKCMKLEFTFPGGRHMWVVPSTPVPEAELEGYRALKFTYKADLPDGIKGLLVTLIESSGGQYYADPPPPASADWTTIEIPLANLKKASWGRDPNNTFDLADVSKVNIGTHGTAKPGPAKGVICVAGVQLVP